LLKGEGRNGDKMKHSTMHLICYKLPSFLKY